jgi:hypothetical protein
MSDQEFRALAETAVESRLGRAASDAVRVWSAAWRESSVVGVVRRAAAVTNDWTAIDRAQFSAIAIATMALGHLGLVTLVPAYVAPALPPTFMAAVALLAAAVAAAPHGFVRGWHQSRLRQAARRLADRSQNNDA